MTSVPSRKLFCVSTFFLPKNRGLSGAPASDESIKKRSRDRGLHGVVTVSLLDTHVSAKPRLTTEKMLGSLWLPMSWFLGH
jgi:hypothetical protein